MYRVIQWATGSMGTESLGFIIDHPDLDLVGVYVYSEEKEGIDAGLLCGRPPTGVKATRDIEEILTLQADCVIHTPMLEPDTGRSDQEVIRLLASGKNVLSCRGHQWPSWRGDEFAEPFERAGREGNASLYGSGISPGFVFDRLALVCTSLAMRVRSVTVTEMFDCRTRPAHTIFEVCGFGQSEQFFSAAHPLAVTLSELYNENFHLLAAEMGTTVTKTDTQLRLALAEKELVLESGTIAPGGAVGVNFYFDAYLDNGVKLRLDSRWFVDINIPGWETADRKQGWRIAIEGEPSMTVDFQLDESLEDVSPYADYDPTHRAIAAVLLNAIPEVVAAPPGVVLPKLFGSWRQNFDRP